MAETVNIGEIAGKLSRDIFRHFLWSVHPKTDDNFLCVNDKHESTKGVKKETHPGDAVFHYLDPYLGKRVYLHTDLKCYGKKTITHTKLRAALRSLCWTVDCARFSESWKEKYVIDDTEQYEVRGFLFIYNHDHGYEKYFYNEIEKINLQGLPLEAGTQLHFMGPDDVNRIYNIANDLIRLKYDGELPEQGYSFYYPDLVMTRRQGDVWDQPATVEALTSPYLIIKHEAIEGGTAGYIIYYNAQASCVEEFEYFLDSLSRFQMLESGERILVRVTNQKAPSDLKSLFLKAQRKYIKAWGFEPSREGIINNIKIDRVTSLVSNYNPGDVGWREK